ncbi:hypothetical protein IWQ61_002432 [Dispira simplex]|nr:hypothetical protein IWQ61_002432 [Dispira simplex]
MRWELEILTTGGPESPQTSVVVHMSKQKYLFNCPESLQRFGGEYKVRFAKLSHIFFTQVNWATLGGLPGMMLTLGDVGIKKMHLAGGPNLLHAIASTRSFIQRSGITVQAQELFDANLQPAVFQDDELRVIPVLGYPIPEISLETFENYTGPLENGVKRSRLEDGRAVSPVPDALQRWHEDRRLQTTVDRSHLEGLIKKMFNTSTTETFPDPPATSPCPAVLSYICQGPAVPGKFNLEAALKLGVPKGRSYGKLVAGHAVTLADGSVIEPHQCVSPGRPGSVFIIVDCPSLDYVSSIVENPAFIPYQQGGSQPSPACVVHIVHEAVIASTKYQDWMGRFDKDTHHVISNRCLSGDLIQFGGSSREQLALRELDPTVFHGMFQGDSGDPTLWETMADKLPPQSHLAVPMTEVQVEPRVKYNTDNQAQRFDPDQIRQEYIESELLSIYRNTVSRIHQCQDETMGEESHSSADTDDFGNVVFSPLGTGSALPSRYRNVSANLVYIPTRGAILLDVGEGTYGQLYRLLGSGNSYHPLYRITIEECMAQLHLIYVSHMHADHHIGLAGVLSHWNRLTRAQGITRNLTIIGPPQLLLWLIEYNHVESLGLEDGIHLVNCENLLYFPNSRYKAPTPPNLEPLCQSLGFDRIRTCRAIHCSYAYCVTFDHNRKWRLSYSGDTRPNPAFIQQAMNTDLLIHEATLEDSLSAEAKVKRHCTTSEAFGVARDMQARYTMLTHFSQRYPQAPAFLTRGGFDWATQVREGAHVGVAFDLMSVRMDDFPKLTRYMPALQSLYNVIEAKAEPLLDLPFDLA